MRPWCIEVHCAVRAHAAGCDDPGRAGGWRGLDLLHFEGGRLTEKHTYAKASSPIVNKKQDSERVRLAIDTGQLLDL